MKFDKWFYSQSTLVKVLLLLIPFVGWAMELFIRLSVAIREQDALHWVVFILFVAVGWTWVLCVVDLIYFLLKGRLILA
ncbi:MAG: hypothetical protein E7380_06725 [Clostridiales bacterium]|nr:hypothetical protein [Clostridiales bacterium]MBQ2768863.1 hypothetical protein [Clostridia bacterium]